MHVDPTALIALSDVGLPLLDTIACTLHAFSLAAARESLSSDALPGALETLSNHAGTCATLARALITSATPADK
jgi:hypothetical protein